MSQRLHLTAVFHRVHDSYHDHTTKIFLYISTTEIKATPTTLTTILLRVNNQRPRPRPHFKTLSSNLNCYPNPTLIHLQIKQTLKLNTQKPILT